MWVVEVENLADVYTYDAGNGQNMIGFLCGYKNY